MATVVQNDLLDLLRPKSTLESVKIQCTTGKRQESSSVLKPPVKKGHTEGTMSSPLLDLNARLDQKLPPLFKINEKECVTAGSLHLNNLTTLNDKSTLLPTSTPPLMSSKTLVPESTSSGKVFSSYSREQLMEFTAQLWCPVGTDLPDSDSICFNGCSSTTKSVSWCSIKTLEQKNRSLQRTSSVSYTFLPARLTVKEGILTDSQKPKKKKLKKKETVIEVVERKMKCPFVVTKKIKGTVYGRECGSVLVKGELVCPKHLNKKQPAYSSFWNWCCGFIIQKRGTGVDENRSRKGLVCGEFCLEGATKCSIHKKCSSTLKGNKILRAFRVRTFPTANQKAQLEKLFGDTRKTFNLVVDKGVGISDVDKGKELESTLKKEILSDLVGCNYLKDTPRDIRGFAIKEYLAGLKAAKKNYERKLATEEWKFNVLKEKGKKYRKKKIKIPEMKYRLRRENQCITVPHRFTKVVPDNGGSIVFCPRTISEPFKLQPHAVKRNKLLQRIILEPNVVENDFKLTKTKTNRYYFCFSYEPNVKSGTKKSNVCSIDPGVRTPWSVWSPQGTVHEIGKEASSRYKLLNEAIARIKHKQFILKDHSSRLRQQRLQLHSKLTNITSDLHFKTINELIDKYGTIVLPWFNSKQMIQGNKLNKTTKRAMTCLSHSTFRNRLISKAIVSGNCVIVPADEYKTTMTCHKCITEMDVGSKEVFRCTNCNLCTGRDINAPINIFVRQVKL